MVARRWVTVGAVVAVAVLVALLRPVEGNFVPPQTAPSAEPETTGVLAGGSIASAVSEPATGAGDRNRVEPGPMPLQLVIRLESPDVDRIGSTSACITRGTDRFAGVCRVDQTSITSTFALDAALPGDEAELRLPPNLVIRVTNFASRSVVVRLPQLERVLASTFTRLPVADGVSWDCSFQPEDQSGAIQSSLATTLPTEGAVGTLETLLANFEGLASRDTPSVLSIAGARWHVGVRAFGRRPEPRESVVAAPGLVQFDLGSRRPVLAIRGPDSFEGKALLFFGTTTPQSPWTAQRAFDLERGRGETDSLGNGEDIPAATPIRCLIRDERGRIGRLDSTTGSDGNARLEFADDDLIDPLELRTALDPGDGIGSVWVRHAVRWQRTAQEMVPDVDPDFGDLVTLAADGKLIRLASLDRDLHAIAVTTKNGKLGFLDARASPASAFVWYAPVVDPLRIELPAARGTVDWRLSACAPDTQDWLETAGGQATIDALRTMPLPHYPQLRHRLEVVGMLGEPAEFRRAEFQDPFQDR